MDIVTTFLIIFGLFLLAIILAIIKPDFLVLRSPKLKKRDREGLEVGDRGVTLTSLRPSGFANFNGKKFDVLSDYNFIKEGEEIEIIEISEKILVKKVDEREDEKTERSSE